VLDVPVTEIGLERLKPNLMGSAGLRSYIRIVPICAAPSGAGKRTDMQEIAAFTAVAGAVIALVAAYSLWALSGRK
jgi:hypothetical protein